MIDGFINDDFLIYVSNNKEWCDIQEYLFKCGVIWCGLEPYMVVNDDNIIFPHYLVIEYIKDENIWVMGNMGVDRHSINLNQFNIFKSSQILRKEKLKEINLSVQ
jgi:hypothetical protein